MAPITKCIALFSLVLSATALTSPHISNNVFNHRRGVAHVAVQAATSPVDVPPTPRKRSLNKRCVPKPSGNSTVSSTSTSTSTSVAATSAPVNVAPSPVIPTTSPTSSHSSSTSTSVYQAPTTSPTPTPTPTPTTTSAPATTSTSSSGSSNGFLSGTQSGQGTFYATGLGACGITNNDSQYIAAVSHLLFDAYPGYDGVNPNTNPVCNKQVTAHYGGKSVQVTITDRCTGCALQDLDFSPSAFTQLADESLGRIDITWAWS
ncbi:RlpA-like double-psi beta-barrel-protein domain-containing protein-containing protein [Suillus clintonianus]|uniref:RlpA-like double-psi beta-barrel-protein domain-containing protein-containing protein n=1 Tax=Suillus clintonianus TaxID=1904413 RepID=UPI001B87290F|nr:RlpA-like double-psi beta-barrel-protein domain-containing protein-containing protein [Suillus clintonianus]KAG2118444.1 RlpA-like double-psi beta-barrel-protein domain-containing protein-containing protein [Suillus clintonianus]